MMTPECTFVLPNTQKCRGSARRGKLFCRHHDPTSSVVPPVRHIPKTQSWSRHRRWLAVNRDLFAIRAADLPDEIFQILHALLGDGEDGISDREAGRLLRVFIRRNGSVPAIPGTEPETQSGIESESEPTIQPNPGPFPSLPHLGFDPEALANRKYDLLLLNRLATSLGIPERAPELPSHPGPNRSQPDLLQMRPDPRQVRPHLPPSLPSSESAQ
jgi:hypothetical protein